MDFQLDRRSMLKAGAALAATYSLPFLAAMIGALALITLIPDLVLYLPRQFGYKG